MPNRKEPQLNLNPANSHSVSNQVRSEDPAPYYTGHSSSSSVETSFDSNSTANGGFKALSILALMLGLAALALSGWLFYSAGLQTAKSDRQLTRLIGRLEEIELALADTGKNLSQTGNTVSSQFTQVNSQLKTHLSEIRKLWAVAHQTNTPAIEALEKTTASLNNQLKQQQTALTTSNKQLKQLENSTNNQLGELNLVTSTLREDLTQLKQLNQQFAALKERLVNLEQTASTQEIAHLKSQLTEQQELLRSLETSRNQLVQRLTKLDAEMQALQN